MVSYRRSFLETAVFFFSADSQSVLDSKESVLIEEVNRPARMKKKYLFERAGTDSSFSDSNLLHADPGEMGFARWEEAP